MPPDESCDFVSETDQLADALAEINEQEESLILCGAGYGIPREARPRQEKILAISRQLVNALQQHGNQNYHYQSRRMPQRRFPPSAAGTESCLVSS